MLNEKEARVELRSIMSKPLRELTFRTLLGELSKRLSRDSGDWLRRLLSDGTINLRAELSKALQYHEPKKKKKPAGNFGRAAKEAASSVRKKSMGEKIKEVLIGKKNADSNSK